MRIVFFSMTLTVFFALKLIACTTNAPIDIGLAQATRDIIAADSFIPISAFVIDTAQQKMPLDTVLEGANAGTEHNLSYPSFVLRWPAQGEYPERVVLIDAGFAKDDALEFGKALQSMVWTAKKMKFKTSLKTSLNKDVNQVELVLFTHLHHDHISGLASLCSTGQSTNTNEQGAEKKFTALISQAQADHASDFANTEKGLNALQALPCFDIIRAELDDGKYTAIDSKRYPGLYVMRTAGHTPGSQTVLARTTQGWMLFVGDLVNASADYKSDTEFGRPKPFLYRAIFLQEDEPVLKGIRKDLHSLLSDDVTIVISHDTQNITASGLRPYAP